MNLILAFFLFDVALAVLYFVFLALTAGVLWISDRFKGRP